MNKYIKTITISALFLSFVAIAPVFAQAQVNGDDDTVAAAPSQTLVSNGDDETAGSSASTDATLNGSDDTTGSSASTGGSNTGNNGNGDDDTSGSPASTGGTNTGGTSNGDDDTSGSAPSNPSNPSTPVDNGGGNGGSGSSRNNRTSASSTLPTLGNIGSCSYINDYMKLDGTNSVAEVTKLQTFLKNTEKLNVDINGKFDQKTVDAVKAFQAKYVNEIMAPWGVTTPTGQVFYTTKKKINEIYCKSTFSLTPAQIAQIEAYRKGLADGTIEVDANGSEINATGTIPLLPEVGSADSSQTASVAGFGTRIWNFIKWLFGY